MTADERKTRASAWFEALRDRICERLEAIEAAHDGPGAELAPGRFERKPWRREEGGGGEDMRDVAASRLHMNMVIITWCSLSFLSFNSPKACARRPPSAGWFSPPTTPRPRTISAHHPQGKECKPTRRKTLQGQMVRSRRGYFILKDSEGWSF